MEITEMLNMYTRLVYDNEKSFVEEFLEGEDREVWEIVEFYMGSRACKVKYSTMNGLHYSRYLCTLQFLDWVDSLEENKGE